MKVTITYNLEREEDELKYHKHLKAVSMSSALYELATKFRSADKYNTFNGSNLTTDLEQCLMSEIHKTFWSVMKEYDLDPFND